MKIFKFVRCAGSLFCALFLCAGTAYAVSTNLITGTCAPTVASNLPTVEWCYGEDDTTILYTNFGILVNRTPGADKNIEKANGTHAVGRDSVTIKRQAPATWSMIMLITSINDDDIISRTYDGNCRVNPTPISATSHTDCANQIQHVTTLVNWYKDRQGG